MMRYTPVPIEQWKTKALHTLYTDVVVQAYPLRLQALLHRIQELEFEQEEERDAPHRPQE